MESMYSKAGNLEIVSRINNLTPDSPALWGKMNVSQMLAHCQVQIHVAFGDTKLKRNLLGLLFGRIVKKKIAGEAPLRKSLPTDKSFIISDSRNFNEEKEKLLVLVQRISDEGEDVISNEAHPFFGELSKSEWNTIIWKHLDHHLKQFGV